MACRFPHAPDLPSFWKVIEQGEVTFEDINDERWLHRSFFRGDKRNAPDKTYVRRGGYIDDFDHFAARHYGISPRRVQVMDPQQRWAIEMTRQALCDAGYD